MGRGSVTFLRLVNFQRLFPKVVTKHDIGGREVQADSDINTKKIMHKFLFFTLFGQRDSR